jgi:4-nitrophenyl phosphatase
MVETEIRPSKITSREQAEQFLSQYDDFLFDCDGVLWQGTHLLPYVVETLALLRARNKRLIFVTNNSTKSRKAYTKKFAKFGLIVSEEEIFGSSYSSAVYLDQVIKFPRGKKVLVIGEAGIEEELDHVGIKYVGGTDPSFSTNLSDDALDSLKRDPSIGAVLCGLDMNINYYKIAHAMTQLRDKDTLFLATNIDSTYPSHGKLLPGAGTIVGTLITCTGRSPVALGKPSSAMMDCIKAKFHFDPKRACMVGDRINTDMVFGVQGGLGTLFVMTGVDSEESILAENALATPNYYIDKLGSLFEFVSQDLNR